MSSSRRGSRWSLRARLLVGQITLLATVCVGIGAVTEFALHQYLVHQLDGQLAEVAGRSAAILGEPLPPPPPGRSPRLLRPGPGPDFLDAPGQPVGLVAAVIGDGRVASAGYLTRTGERAAVPDAAQAALADLAARAPRGTPPPDPDPPGDPGPPRARSRAQTVTLADLGRYRVVVTPARRGDATVVVGLPMAEVDDTLLRVLLIFGVVTVAALAVAASVGALVVTRALAPLHRVADAAGRVTDLPLHRGEVALPVRVGAADANPATEVGRLGQALNRMLDHVGAALQARQASETRVRQFVADASHELRTPLTAIRGYTELALRGPDGLTPEVAHALRRVESEAERMTHLVEDLLLLARLDSGRPLEREPVDLTRLAVDTISDAHVAAPGHRWNLELPDEPVVVTGDAARLHQVVANLLTNAGVHTPAGTTVTLSLRTEGDAAVLDVADDGPGVPADLQAEVFERFARGDSSRSRQAGSTGLGLAIAAAVVRAHGGRLSLRSAPGETVFTVRLPA